MSFTRIPELKDSYRKLGPARFGLVMLAVCGWVGGSIWLHLHEGWPERFGFQCRGRGCWVADLEHSPVLLHGGVAEYVLFADIWSIPAFIIAFTAWKLLRRSPGDLPPADAF